MIGLRVGNRVVGSKIDIHFHSIIFVINYPCSKWKYAKKYVPGSRGGGRVAGFGRDAVVWANGVV